ncbi:MAG: putative toxin-antitoxin system toxin component, PIN family [Chloroflexota bacterium]
MKALVNTNPLVSALLKPEGPSGQIFQRWRGGEFELAVSPTTLAELSDVLRRPHIAKKYPLRDRDIQNHLAVLREFGEVAPGNLTLEVIPDDPKDNHVLSAAVETDAACIVSGDRHLLDMGEYQGIRILTPRDFLTILESADRPNAGGRNSSSTATTASSAPGDSSP